MAPQAEAHGGVVNMVPTIRVDVDATVFDEWVLKAMDDVKEEFVAEIRNPVFYVPYLEYGSSKQAPYGMVRVSLPEAEQMLQAGMTSIDYDKACHEGTLRAAIVDRLNMVADFVMGLIRDRTPIRTGRARRGWNVKEMS